MTALMVACWRENEEAAALLMEATKNAGALDVQRYPALNELGYRSALHIATINGLESMVAKLLSLGADPALKTTVWACSYMNMCKSSVYVCTFVDACRMRISLSIMHIIQKLVCTCNTTLCVCVYMCPCVCRYTHTEAF